MTYLCIKLKGIKFIVDYMGLTYEKDHQAKVKSFAQKRIGDRDEFPACKRLYPDYPKTPSLMDKNCRTCPKTDDLKKPKIE